MAFLNALGRVSRHGQWRFRNTFRVADATGRVDPTDNGLIDFGAVTAAVLTVTPRAPALHRHGCAGTPALPTASLADGSLRVINPGFVEALFPDGWGASVPPGLYDVRLSVTIGPETAVILDEPIAID